MKRILKQLTDQEFENIKLSNPLVKSGKDFYCNTYIGKETITNISYLKNPIGWLKYVEVWSRIEKEKDDKSNP